jgi:hypothetical protein
MKPILLLATFGLACQIRAEQLRLAKQTHLETGYIIIGTAFTLVALYLTLRYLQRLFKSH